MTNTPFFSIIIPCYNSGEYIDETLRSLARQTFYDFEVVVVDDGSYDNSLEVCREAFKKYRLSGETILRPAERIKGVASCRNLGVDLAKGEWLCFLDSDDIFNESKLLLTYQLIQKYGSVCHAYHHACENFDDKTGRLISLNIKGLSEGPSDIRQELMRSNIIVTSAVTLSAKLFNEIGGFNASLHGVEDYFLWLRVSNRTKWCYSQEVLSRYRVREASLMSGREFKYYVEQNSRLYNVIKGSGEFTRAELEVIHSYIIRGLMRYYASVAISGKRKRDFTKGVIHLFQKGELSTAINIYYRYLKHNVLTRLSNFRKAI